MRISTLSALKMLLDADGWSIKCVNGPYTPITYQDTGYWGFLDLDLSILYDYRGEIVFEDGFFSGFIVEFAAWRIRRSIFDRNVFKNE